MPWHSREINLVSGHEKVCCWLDGNIDRASLQTKFLSGQRPQECHSCWLNEDRGIQSRRQMENQFLDHKMDRDLESLHQDACQGLSEINLYQVFLGTICNGTCVTCGPHASSAWQALERHQIPIRQENIIADHHFRKFAANVNWRTAQRINLLGGEPLLMQRSFELLRYLLDADNRDCRVSFVTNGSVRLTAEQVDLLSNFSDVSCCVSLDGIGSVFEYVRYPLSWQRTLDNIQHYRSAFGEVVVSFTVSNLNYFDRDNILSWLDSMGLPYIENYVVEPAWFNYEVMPGHELWPRFCEEIQRQDRLKGISIGDYIPHIYEKIHGRV